MPRLPFRVRQFCKRVAARDVQLAEETGESYNRGRMDMDELLAELKVEDPDAYNKVSHLGGNLVKLMRTNIKNARYQLRLQKKKRDRSVTSSPVIPPSVSTPQSPHTSQTTPNTSYSYQEPLFRDEEEESKLIKWLEYN